MEFDSEDPTLQGVYTGSTLPTYTWDNETKTIATLFYFTCKNC